MRRFAYIVFAAAVISASGAHAMSYGLASFENGTMAVVAQGVIQRSEAARFLSFVQARSINGAVPSTMVISSPGGELVGALTLGQTLRRLGITTIVGAIAADGAGQPALGPGRCQSACVYALMGGVARSVVPGSNLGVHSPLPVMVVDGRAYLPDSTTTRSLVRGTGAALRLYARQMGVNPAVIDVAHGVPFTTMRPLSSSELARYSLVTDRGRLASHRRAERRHARER